MFAMFGATILVPTLTGLSVSVQTLLMAGLGTLLFHVMQQGQGPRIPGLLVRVSSRGYRGRRAHAARRRRQRCHREHGAAALRVLAASRARGFCTSCSPLLFKALGAATRHALLPADRHRPHRSSCIGLNLSRRLPSTTARPAGGVAIVAIVVIVVCQHLGQAAWSRSSRSCWASSAPTWSPPSPATASTSPPVAEAAWIGLLRDVRRQHRVFAVRPAQVRRRFAVSRPSSRHAASPSPP